MRIYEKLKRIYWKFRYRVMNYFVKPREEKTLYDLRVIDAKQLSNFYADGADHPHGLSGHRFLLPRHLTSNCADSKDYNYSEWGNAAGLVPIQKESEDIYRQVLNTERWIT